MRFFHLCSIFSILGTLSGLIKGEKSEKKLLNVYLLKQKLIRNEILIYFIFFKKRAFEGGDIDLSNKYASLIKTVWLSGFYLPVTPIGSLISFFGVVVFYFVDKVRFNFKL